jgi:hypothetical protein
MIDKMCLDKFIAYSFGYWFKFRTVKYYDDILEGVIMPIGQDIHLWSCPIGGDLVQVPVLSGLNCKIKLLSG